MKQRLTQAKLLRAHRAVSALIAVVHDARVRYREWSNLRPRKLASLSRHLKRLAGMPHTTDYKPYEALLKKLLVRGQHRVNGFQLKEGDPVYALAEQLPAVYGPQVLVFNLETRLMLRVLADVPL